MNQTVLIEKAAEHARKWCPVYILAEHNQQANFLRKEIRDFFGEEVQSGRSTQNRIAVRSGGHVQVFSRENQLRGVRGVIYIPTENPFGWDWKESPFSNYEPLLIRRTRFERILLSEEAYDSICCAMSRR